jgi:hypothetical protein
LWDDIAGWHIAALVVAAVQERARALQRIEHAA